MGGGVRGEGRWTGETDICSEGGEEERTEREREGKGEKEGEIDSIRN